MDGEVGFGIRPIDDWSAGGSLEVEMATDEVSMKMRLENIPDRGLFLGSELQVRFDIPERIDNSGFAIALNIVCGFTETTSVELLDKHAAKVMILFS